MNVRNYFILPGLCSLDKLNIKLKQLKNVHREYFYNDVYLTYVQGIFPNAIWNGDTMFFSKRQPLNAEMHDVLRSYQKYSLQPILNFTNSEITKQDCDNIYCNVILQTALNINFNTTCIVNSKELYEYISTNYPNIMKIYLGKNNAIPAENNEPISYFLNPNHNGDIDFLSKLKNKNNITITLNPLCFNCGKMQECLYKEHLAQLNYDPNSSKLCTCSYLYNHEYPLSKNKFNKSRDIIISEYNKLGFSRFALEEYPTPKDNLEEYLFYFIKPEYYHEAKEFLLGGN